MLPQPNYVASLLFADHLRVLQEGYRDALQLVWRQVRVKKTKKGRKGLAKARDIV